MQEVPLFPLWVTVFLTIWGVVGPILGLLAGHFLSASAQRKRWIADNRKEEYRKLLIALHKLHAALSELGSGPVPVKPIYDAMAELSEASNTCLFINHFIESSGSIAEAEKAANAMFRDRKFTEEYRKKHWTAVNQIIESAKRIKA